MPGPGGDDAAKRDWLTGAFGMGDAFAAVGNAASAVEADAQKAVKTARAGGGTAVSGDDPSDRPPLEMADDDTPPAAQAGGGNATGAAEQGAGDDGSDRPPLEMPLDSPAPGAAPVTGYDAPPPEDDGGAPADGGAEDAGDAVGAAADTLFKPQDPIHPSQNDPVEPDAPRDPAIHENPITVQNRGQTSWSLIENNKAVGAGGNAANALPDGSDAADLVNVKSATLRRTINHKGAKGGRLQFDLVITAEGGTLPDTGGSFLRSVKATAASVTVTGGRKVSAQITFQKPQVDQTWTAEMSWEVDAIAVGQAISDANWSATISGNVVATPDKPLIVYYGEKSLADIDAD